jgi:hypothetical protein
MVGLYTEYGCVQTGSARHWCPSLVLPPSLSTTLPNEIGHSAQVRALLLEVVLNVQRHSGAQNVLGTSLNIARGHQCRALSLKAALGKIVASLLVPRKDVSQKNKFRNIFQFPLQA